MGDFIQFKTDEGLLFGKITRPEKRNAVNFRVMDGFREMLDRAERDSSVKAVVITGEGDNAFCAGGDVEEFHRLKTQAEAISMLSRMGSLLCRLAMLPKPTLASINGTAVGGGSEIAAACDFRIARRGARLGFIQANLAITTGWGGGSLLYERLGPSVAFKLLSEADIYTADEMKEIGFLQEVYDTLTEQTAFEYMAKMLQKDSGVIEAYKKAMIEKFHAVRLQERMENEWKRCAELWARNAHHDAVSRFLKQ
ncbi:enoyl-CoA hydratase/isomerase family protein [Siminovitchia sp. 179-K 8D1 HS]|uniref:enoyl-CoA hydratase/isomerase family protein n=1 Tax=Siminovitchia sp. 179-K 8D1 HS TaxID=3142385 RepID=UPI0039A1CF5D